MEVIGSKCKEINEYLMGKKGFIEYHSILLTTQRSWSLEAGVLSMCFSIVIHHIAKSARTNSFSKVYQGLRDENGPSAPLLLIWLKI
jgi:hypothetical protein